MQNRLESFQLSVFFVADSKYFVCEIVYVQSCTPIQSEQCTSTDLAGATLDIQQHYIPVDVKFDPGQRKLIVLPYKPFHILYGTFIMYIVFLSNTQKPLGQVHLINGLGMYLLKEA